MAEDTPFCYRMPRNAERESVWPTPLASAQP